MKFYFSILLLFIGCSINGQNSLNAEVDRISNSLIRQLMAKKIRTVAVADFAYQGQPNTRIGYDVANLISNKLTKNGGSIQVISRMKTRQALAGMEEPPQQPKFNVGTIVTPVLDALKDGKNSEDQKMIDHGGKAASEVLTRMPKSGGKKLKEAEVIIYGNIEDAGDYLQINIEGTKNDSKGINVAVEDGSVVITPEISGKLNGSVSAASTSGSTTPGYTETTSGSTMSVKSKNQNLSFEVIRSYQKGNEVECKLNVLSSNIDDQFGIEVDATKIVDANGGNEFVATEVSLADKSGTQGWVTKDMVANYPIEVTLTFSNVNKQVLNIARLEIKTWSSKLGNFETKLYDISNQ